MVKVVVLIGKQCVCFANLGCSKKNIAIRAVKIAIATNTCKRTFVVSIPFR